MSGHCLGVDTVVKLLTYLALKWDLKMIRPLIYCVDETKPSHGWDDMMALSSASCRRAQRVAPPPNGFS